MELAYKNERPLFITAVVLASIFWVALTLGTFGVALIFILFSYVLFLFAHSAFISHLKGTGVRITENQYPDLYQRLVRCCQKVGVEEIPEAYLLRTDFFNALATRFLGRNFVVLFTDVIDALEGRPGAVDFYMGHELGHIHRKHLLWAGYIFPASTLPLLGAAHRRAEEYTCDRYGAVCCESDADAGAALAAIAAGDTRWKSMNVGAYLQQTKLTSGFWMSFNELTSDYPWLTKRMATVLALRKGGEPNHPRRHPLAWVLSCFVPRFGGGGAMLSVMVSVAVIGILAAVAIPAYQDYVHKAGVMSGYEAALPIREKVTRYAAEKKAWPASLTDLGYANETLDGPEGRYNIAIYEEGLIGVDVGVDGAGEERYIVLEPLVEQGELVWECYGQNLDTKYLPQACR